MSAIQELFLQAQLAKAAYANLLDDHGRLLITDVGVASALELEGFSESEAAAFVTHWRLVHHTPNTVHPDRGRTNATY